MKTQTTSSRLSFGRITNKVVIVIAAIIMAGLHAAVAANGSALKYGLYIHFSTTTFANPGEKGKVPAARFAPTELDVKQWARTAKDAGMTFAVLTAKHDSGFCLWDSKDYDYALGGSPVKTDIIADFIAACEAEGIAPGVHYSIPDNHNESSIINKGPVPPLYFNVIKKHITELHTKYPKLRVQIIRGSNRLSPTQWNELVQIVHRLNPSCQMLDWTHSPTYGTQTVIKSWMWEANGQLNTPEFLFTAYSGRAKMGTAWLGSVGVDRTGQIPAEQIAVLMELKNMVGNPSAARASATPLKNGAPAQKPDAADRLKKLKDLYQQGLISKEDYDRKVKEIMDSL